MSSDKVASNLLSIFSEEELKAWASDNRFLQYQKDPVKFGEKELGESYTDEVKELMSSVMNHQITIAMSATAVGKSHSAATLALWAYKCFPDSKVYTLASPPENNLRTVLWGEINRKVCKRPQLFKNDKINDLRISKNKWNFIEGITIPTSGSEQDRESKVSGKHSAYLFFILDEGDAIPDEIYRGIDGCMSGENNRLLIMFNPKKEQGAAYRYIQTGRANVVSLSAFSHPNVISGYDVIPGAVSRAKTLERINEQTEALREGEEPNSECFEVPEFLVGTTTKNGKGIDYPPLKAGYRKIREQEFYYKVLGRYPAKGEDQLISRDWVDAARNRWDLYVAQFGEKPPEGIRPVIGLDVADMGEDENCLVARYGGYVEMPEKWHGVDPGETSEYASDIARDKKSLVVNVDSIGVGADVAPNIRRKKVKASRIMTSEKPTERPKKKKAFFRKLRDQLWWDVRDWLENDNTAMLPPSNTLIEELLVATYEERDGKIVIMSKEKMKKLLRRSPNEADALCLTFAPKPQPPQVRLIG